MELNADFSKRVLIHSDEVEWLPSPMPGVERRMLDRVGGEVARATSIVRYAPNSHFSSHVHTGGEEFIVLEGVFQDEHGDYPVGSYVRNPPNSSHTPGSDDGCTIFVKLWQFDLSDRTQVKSNMYDHAPLLFEDTRETVQFETWQPNADVKLDLPQGGEFLVLEGGFNDGTDDLRRHSWLRLPKGSVLSAVAGSDGAKVWLKTRHLRFTEPPSV